MSNLPKTERDQQRLVDLLWTLRGTLDAFLKRQGYRVFRQNLYTVLCGGVSGHDATRLIEHVALVMARVGNDTAKDLDAELRENESDPHDTYRLRAEHWYDENRETVAEVFMALSSGVTLPDAKKSENV